MSIIRQFEEYKRSGTANNITVGVLAVMGMICGAKSFTGTQISLVEYCFKPTNDPKFCTAQKRYIMPESEFYAQMYAPANPEFQRESFLPSKATRLRTIPPSNPDKPIWGLAATMLMGGAYTLSKARERRLIQLMPEYREQTRTDWLISKLWHGLRLHKEAYSAQVDYEFHQWTENRKARAAQLSQMSPQELAIYTQQVRLQAEAEAQEQLQRISGQPALTGQTLNDVTRSDDKVEGSNQEAMPAATPSLNAPQDKHYWMKHPVGYPTLIFGGMGAGKSWTTREIIWRKVQALWDIVVLDPHGTSVEWRGVRLYSGYKEIAEFMQWYMDEMRQRYEDYRKSGLTEEQWTENLRASGKMLSVICEEFTTWTDNIIEPMPSNCEDDKWKPDPDFVGKWFRCAMTESRKQLMIPLFVAHDRTMEILAKAKGLSKLRDAALLEVELIATIDPITTEAKASGQGKIKLPGHGQWIDIELPKLDHKRIDFRLDESRTVNEPPTIDKATLERIYELEFNLNSQVENTPPEQNQLSPMAQKLYEYLTRTERITADVREFKSNFKVAGERFTVEQIKGWMYEIVGAGKADWIAEGVIRINQI